jgi:SSS family solute:Na+ symporter
MALIGFVILYLLVSIAIGLYAARNVSNSSDYVVAGRHLPLYIVIATVFATWFGSETVLGISATFAQEGLKGVVSDPFGASSCLILVGLFFATKLYRMKLLTIGDYYRIRYNDTVERMASIAIITSYLGWVSAQIKALGLVFNILSQGYLSVELSMVLGTGIVVLYTLFGGMWSVAMTDFLQMIVISIGMLFVAYFTSEMAGGITPILTQAVAEGKFHFLPPLETGAIIGFIGAFLTMAFGSIPQQDVFQRVMSARNEKTAVRGSIIGGSLYLIFAFIPMFLVLTAASLDPALFNRFIDTDSQRILPTLILEKTPLIVQVFFFGALLSAIMSTVSATLLAPSALFTENILKPMILKKCSDKTVLWTMRSMVMILAICVLNIALHTNASIYQMVEHAYKITLSVAFVPLAFGLYWKRADTLGAYLAMAFGFFAWIGFEIWAPDHMIPPQMAGLLASITGMLIGSRVYPFIKHLWRQARHHMASQRPSSSN